MGMKTHEYEFIDNAQHGKVIGSVWWNGRKVVGSSPTVEFLLDNAHPAGFSRTSGVKFLENLPAAFRNGYLAVKRVRKDDE